MKSQRQDGTLPKIKIGAAVATVAIAVAVILTPLPAFASAHPPHRSDAVSAWNANAGEAAIAACISPADNPLHESRMYAMTHVAIHDALNAIDRRSRPYAFSARVKREASPDAAVAAAARDVLVPLLNEIPEPFPPACGAAGVASVEADYAAALSEIPDGRAETRGIQVGQAAAAAILALRAGDGADTPLIVTDTHRARIPVSTASHPVPRSRLHQAGRTSPRSCCETVRNSVRGRPMR
jgi:hypothetical protein